MKRGISTGSSQSIAGADSAFCLHYKNLLCQTRLAGQILPFCWGRKGESDSPLGSNPRAGAKCKRGNWGYVPFCTLPWSTNEIKAWKADNMYLMASLIFFQLGKLNKEMYITCMYALSKCEVFVFLCTCMPSARNYNGWSWEIMLIIEQCIFVSPINRIFMVTHSGPKFVCPSGRPAIFASICPSVRCS